MGSLRGWVGGLCVLLVVCYVMLCLFTRMILGPDQFCTCPSGYVILRNGHEYVWRKSGGYQYVPWFDTHWFVWTARLDAWAFYTYEQRLIMTQSQDWHQIQGDEL